MTRSYWEQLLPFQHLPIRSRFVDDTSFVIFCHGFGVKRDWQASSCSKLPQWKLTGWKIDFHKQLARCFVSETISWATVAIKKTYTMILRTTPKINWVEKNPVILSYCMYSVIPGSIIPRTAAANSGPLIVLRVFHVARERHPERHLKRHPNHTSTCGSLLKPHAYIMPIAQGSRVFFKVIFWGWLGTALFRVRFEHQACCLYGRLSLKA